MNLQLTTGRCGRTFASRHGPDGAFPDTPEYACPVTVYRRSWIDRHPRLLMCVALAFVAVAAGIAAGWPA